MSNDSKDMISEAEPCIVCGAAGGHDEGCMVAEPAQKAAEEFAPEGTWEYHGQRKAFLAGAEYERKRASLQMRAPCPGGCMAFHVHEMMDGTFAIFFDTDILRSGIATREGAEKIKRDEFTHPVGRAS